MAPTYAVPGLFLQFQIPLASSPYSLAQFLKQFFDVVYLNV